jgi:DNA-binding IclR family transcriptional regulator
VDRRPLAPNTITDKDEFLKELSRIRQNGYAIDDEEMSIGLRCIAVPIFDHNHYPAYAVSVSGPAMRLTHRVLEEIKPRVLEVSEALSHKMGS